MVPSSYCSSSLLIVAACVFPEDVRWRDGCCEFARRGWVEEWRNDALKCRRGIT